MARPLKKNFFLRLPIVTLDEDTGQLNKRVVKHLAGEVWSLDPSPSDPAVFISTFGRKQAGMYKEPLPKGGRLSSLLGKNIKLSRREGNIMAVGKNIKWKKGKGKAITSSL